MKKTIALLTALLVMLSPMLALADGALRRVTTWEADAEGVAGWLRCLGVSEEAAARVGTASADLMNILCLETVVNNDGSRGDYVLSMDGRNYFTMSFAMDEDAVTYLFDLLPGYALRMETMDPDLMTASMLEFAQKTYSRVDAWMAGIQEPVVETGNFVGDAYTCTRREILTIHDKDLAVLLRGILEDVSDIFGDLRAIGETLDRLLADLERKDQGRWQMVTGYDDKGIPVGFSMSLGTEDATYLTLSQGISQDDSLKVVVGLATGHSMWYADLVVNAEIADDFSGMTMTVAARLLKAEGNETYRAAAQRDPMLTLDLCTGTTAAGSDSTVRLTLPNGNVVGEKATADNRTYGSESVVTYGTDEAVAWRFHNVVTEAETLPSLDLSDCTLVTMEEYAASSLPQDVMDNLIAIAVEMVMNLPASVLNLFTGR